MSATTFDTETAKRQYEIAQALHLFGDMYYQGHVPELKHAGSPIEIHVVASSADEVERFAMFNDLDVSHIRPGDGTFQTVANLVIAPDAVTVRVVHIARSV